MSTFRDARPGNRLTLRLALGFTVSLLIGSVGCGSTSTTDVVGPSDPRCTIALAQSPPSAPAGATSGSVTVIAARECAWSVQSEAAWITITSSSAGQGNGRVDYSVAANPASSSRRGVVVIGELRTEILQAAAPCEIALDPVAASFPAEGGEATIGVSTLPGCGWTASRDVPWITVASGGSGDGGGTVRVTVADNPGAPRTGSVTIGGQIYTATQAAKACESSLSPVTQAVAREGGTFAVQVTTPAWCDWTATSNVAWIGVASGGGTGSGSVTLTVSANEAGPRTGIAAIAGQIYTVTQAAAACTYAIDPTARDVAAQGGTFGVQAMTQTWCDWNASSNAPWITIASGGTRTGTGTVSLSIAVNQGGARTGTATIAGDTHTVSQEAADCTPVISPAAQDAPAQGGAFAVQVTAQSWCLRSATSHVPWISVTSGGTGTGGGTVNLTVAANAGAPRSGTVAIAGQTYTVAQAGAPCTYAINPATQAVPAEGGAVAVEVTTQAWCARTAASSVPWIAVTGGSTDTGTGAVNLSVAANTAEQRIGTVTIGGHTYTITQAAAACTYAISPATQAASGLSGTFVVQVMTFGSCAWTARSNASWMTVASGSSGAGSGTVTLTVSANLITTRTGTVTIAGQSYTLTQAGLLGSTTEP